MSYVYYNPNPNGKNVGDCVIRAISKATNMDWESVYTGICVTGYSMCDMPSANCVWGAYLRDNGFVRDVVPNECPECYNVADFAREHPQGTYITTQVIHFYLLPIEALQQRNYIEERRNVIESEKQAANTSSNIESVALSVDNA